MYIHKKRINILINEDTTKEAYHDNNIYIFRNFFHIFVVPIFRRFPAGFLVEWLGSHVTICIYIYKYI